MSHINETKKLIDRANKLLTETSNVIEYPEKFGLYKIDTIPSSELTIPSEIGVLVVKGTILELNTWAKSKDLKFVKDNSIFGGYYTDKSGTVYGADILRQKDLD